MSDKLTIKAQTTSFSIEGFDRDTEMELSLHDNDDNTLGVMWLSPNQCNSIITYLSMQLKKIGEPIDILSKNNHP